MDHPFSSQSDSPADFFPFESLTFGFSDSNHELVHPPARRFQLRPALPLDGQRFDIYFYVMPLSIGSSLPSGPTLKIMLLQRRGVEPDGHVSALLEHALTEAGHEVFVDRGESAGVDWAKQIEEKIRHADVAIALLSEHSIHSEIFSFEVEHSHEAAQGQQGKPHLIPVRVAFSESLPDSLGAILDSLAYHFWEGPQDDGRLKQDILNALAAIRPISSVRLAVSKGLRLLPRPTPLPKSVRVRVEPPTPAPTNAAPVLEPVGGAVPLNSNYYLQRPADQELRTALTRYDSIILVKGARQIGKTSLMARGLQYARERGARVALTDFQKFNASNLDNVSSFFITLAESLVDQLELPVLPSDVWDERRGASVNFERLLRREVLKHLNAPLVWGLDEVDRLFTCPFGSEVFGLFRSWHNERALDPSGPWAGLTLVIAYATEAHLFITDMNQSPFNVGTRLALEDFTLPQVEELNRRYGSPLSGTEDVRRFMALVGGHPFLVRRGLNELASGKATFEEFSAKASRDDGIFGDHLRRILVLLARDAGLSQVMAGVLRGQSCPTPESFYRLRSAGIIHGDSQDQARPRCSLYSEFLLRHI